MKYLLLLCVFALLSPHIFGAPSKCATECINGRCARNKCTCNKGWSGAACDVLISNGTVTIDCNPKCTNGGSCVAGACACPPNWGGPACDMPCDKWRPRPGTSWQIILSGDFSDTSAEAELYDIDLFNTKQAAIDKLHSMGRKVICYFSAGSIEKGRPDTNLFTPALKSIPMDGWPEYWIDISKLTTEPRLKEIMRARLDLAVKKKCDGVDPDNVDAYSNGVPGVTYKHQIEYNQWMALEARARGLLIGLKNDLEQVPDLVKYYDFSVNEECFEYKECDLLTPFINANKAVFNIEYNVKPAQYCYTANLMKIDSLFKTRDVLPKPFTQCRTYPPKSEYQCASTFIMRALDADIIENDLNGTNGTNGSNGANGTNDSLTKITFSAEECMNKPACIIILTGTIVMSAAICGLIIYVTVRLYRLHKKKLKHMKKFNITSSINPHTVRGVEMNRIPSPLDPVCATA